jgi:hypothetical protein
MKTAEIIDLVFKIMVGIAIIYFIFFYKKDSGITAEQLKVHDSLNQVINDLEKDKMVFIIQDALRDSLIKGKESAIITRKENIKKAIEDYKQLPDDEKNNYFTKHFGWGENK